MSQPRSTSKPRYRTTNWPGYNAALKSRGSLNIWLDPRMQWFAAASGKRGRSPKFSDAAIQFCLTIKNLFGLALRQTMGFVESLLQLSGLHWPVPDFSRRMQTFRQEDMESVEWLPPAQLGGDQDELHQTTGRSGHFQNV